MFVDSMCSRRREEGSYLRRLGPGHGVLPAGLRDGDADERLAERAQGSAAASAPQRRRTRAPLQRRPHHGTAGLLRAARRHIYGGTPTDHGRASVSRSRTRVSERKRGFIVHESKKGYDGTASVFRNLNSTLCR